MDTKYEMGRSADGRILLIDEASFLVNERTKKENMVGHIIANEWAVSCS